MTTGAEWDLRAATATSAFVIRAASTGPASSRGSATARRAGGGSSATKVRKERDVGEERPGSSDWTQRKSNQSTVPSKQCF